MTGPLPMTAGRRAALILGTPLALFTIGYTALTGVAWAGQGSYPVNLNLPVQGQAVSLTADAGNLTVGPASPATRLQVRGTAHYALTRSRVTWQATAAGTTVNARCRQLTGPCTFDLRVAMPADVAAVITDQAGDITASTLSGPQIRLHGDAGDITVTGLASPDVQAEDSAGNITLRFTSVPSTVRVSDDAGDVTLVLPPGTTAYQVSAHALAGNTTIRVATAPSSRHRIAVTNQAGDITIRY